MRRLCSWALTNARIVSESDTAAPVPLSIMAGIFIAAIAAAHARGVDVQVILDRSQLQGRHPVAAMLAAAGTPVFIDTRPAIAHSKVLIIDNNVVVTGSFNFTRSAQQRNAENVLILRHDRTLVAAFLRNWSVRRGQSLAYGEP